MASAVKALAEEVKGLANLPAGPERAAACTRPRRRCWEVLATVQSSVIQLSSQAAASAGMNRCKAEDALQLLEELRALLEKLHALDKESCASSWALTEYIALVDEIKLARVEAGRLGASVTSDQAAGSQPPLAMYSTLEDEEVSAIAAAAAVSVERPVRSPEKGHPVRLSPEDLHDDFHDHPCGWTVDGVCSAGCTVSGCKARTVEAW
mmetsp:Transcript_99060/g.212202  ORF Transcript_99060/g.212202 Transcript_99060/m.212202 type:complete len:208 (-) Transcript_99060:75-698(-)